MGISRNNQQLTFPPGEFKVQSPYLYLQTVGSTGVDGSTYGADARWLLLRNLGETHLPKGDYAETTINFNRPGDYVTLFRSQYLKRFPTIVDFSVKPDVVNDGLAFWIYTATNTNTVVYIHFRDTAKYTAVRAAISPSDKPLQFVQQYCPGLIEAELKDKLFFAAEFDVERNAATVMRAEALSVESNVPLSPLFVSCRRAFNDRNWCPPAGPAGEPKQGTTVPVIATADVPACCDGPNLLSNGSFEAHGTPFGFETDYDLGGGAKSGAINVTQDASTVRPGWQGLAHTGKSFLAVDGSLKAGSAVLRFNLKVDPETDYCFTGWLATLWLEEVSIPLQFRFTSDNGAVQSFTQSTPATIRTWEEFAFSWNSGASATVTVEIVSLSVQRAGHDFGDFGIDDLWFCKGKPKPADVPTCCDGPNLLPNGDFESHPALPEFMFETDYELGGGAKYGAVNVTTDASSVNHQWEGLPHTGKSFLTVDGSEKPGQATLRFKRDVEPNTSYCFTGWLATLWKNDVSIPLEFRFTSADGMVQSFTQPTPATVRKWEEFSFSWNSGASRTVTVEIISLAMKSIGNDFGIDDLWFCKGRQAGCRARIRSENIRSLRFDVNSGYPRRIEFETYNDYITGALWDQLDNLALTKDEVTAFSRLEPAPNTVNGHWQKFNDNALLNVSNYQDRWTRAGGLSQGVRRYITLSDSDPLAVDTLAGATSQDGSIQISLLDALRMVSLDFHVARMFGLGYLDRNIKNDTDEFIYVGVYDTDGSLDDTNISRPVRHYYMGVPTKPLDHRLPDAPVLKQVTYGLTVENGEEQPEYLTDQQGYTPDGLSRYVNLFVEPDTDAASLNPFFVPPDEFCSVDKTAGVFCGVEYRKQGEASWRKPEIAHDGAYRDLDTPPQFETVPLPNNAASPKPILRHEERENGVHEYGGYDINWFSRVSPVGNIVATDDTLIKPAQRLLPPSNFAVQLVQEELPLMLTTAAEQSLLGGLSGPDKTLVRVTFDYFHVHDINYEFADAVELFFRSDMPRNVVGAIKSVNDDPADGHNAVIRTMDYAVNSQGTTITPALDPTLFGNFDGGVFSCQQQNYIVTSILASSVSGEGPIFTVRKNVQGNASDPGSTGTFVTVQQYTSPQLDASSNAQVMFMAVENMADSSSWGIPNPLSKIITIGDGSWTTHTETYVQDGETITVNLRGVLSSAVVTPQLSGPPGVYRIDFQTYLLPHHPQSNDADPVEWYKGAVRIARAANPNGPKKVLEVFAMEHLGDGQPLVLHVIDNAYDPNDEVITGLPVTVNYYQGYKVFLHADPARNFTAATILPGAGEGNRKTWLGARSSDGSQSYHSPIGIPAPIVALEFVKPLPPEQPVGAEFATPPDFYYKSTYTFLMNLVHKPFAVAMYRANEEAILRALYTDDTYKIVRQQLEILGEDDSYQSDRWKNLLSFDYVYNDPLLPFYDATNSNTNGTFRKFPREDGYAFPNPDKGGPLAGSAPGTIISDLRDAIWGAFTPLSELPLIYDFIKGPTYIPVPKRQNIRNSQGTLLAPNDADFDMAPMAKRTGNGFEIQFTDFTLDGTGNNIFFYFGRELGNRGRLGDRGRIAGPIRLINTRPPDAPAVKKMYVQELNVVDGTGPAVDFEFNAYPEVQKVARMLIYRATDPADALSVRTMQLVKTVDFAETNQMATLSILLSDDFENGFVPYGDPMFYRIVALRKVKNADGGMSWVPSQPSKALLTAMPDTVNPQAPEIAFTSNGLSGSPATLTGVNLSWAPSVHNGTYYLDKMNATGNWVTIYRIKTNDNVTVDLAATDLGTNILPKETEDGPASVYHRFRVRTENSSGLFSLTDKVLTL